MCGSQKKDIRRTSAKFSSVGPIVTSRSTARRMHTRLRLYFPEAAAKVLLLRLLLPLLRSGVALDGGWRTRWCSACAEYVLRVETKNN